MSQYKINVAQTLDSVGAELKIKTKLDLKSPQKEEKEISILKVPELDIVVRNIGEGLLAEGSLNTALVLECERCLSEYIYPLEAEIRELYSKTKPIISGFDVEEIFLIKGIEIENLNEKTCSCKKTN